MKKTILAAALAGSALALFAAPAHADQYDFITVLDNHGVSYTDMPGMINVGKETCHDLRAGRSIDDIANSLLGLNFPAVDAAIIIMAASVNMCPDTLPRVSGYAHPGEDSGKMAA